MRFGVVLKWFGVVWCVLGWFGGVSTVRIINIGKTSNLNPLRKINNPGSGAGAVNCIPNIE